MDLPAQALPNVGGGDRAGFRHAEETSAARLAQSYGQLPISLAVNLVNGLLLAFILWDAVDRVLLSAWLGGLILVTAIRYLALRVYRGAKSGHRGDKRWERSFTAGACAAGIVWGSAGVLLFPASFPHQVFLMFVLGGMVAGAIPMLSWLDRSYPCFAVPVVLPIGIKMLVIGDGVHVIMGAMVLVFGAAMLASSVRVRRVFQDAIDLRLRLSSSIAAGEELERMLRLDELTGIANRRSFEETLAKEWRRAKREGTVLSVITADIDHFKGYNDRYGHPAGDRCLVQVARTMSCSLHRPGDLVARIGGEEFAFLLPDTGLSGAASVAELVRRGVVDLRLAHDGAPAAGQVTVSLGVAASDGVEPESADELLRASDEALYRAKRAGRNRVALAGRRR